VRVPDELGALDPMLLYATRVVAPDIVSAYTVVKVELLLVY
jgi:hypothetical protein